MGWWKRFDLFCQIEGIRPYVESEKGVLSLNQHAVRCFEAEEAGAHWREFEFPHLGQGEDLTFEQIDHLTCGEPGIHRVVCPYCGDSDAEKRTMRVERTFEKAKYVCSYCDRVGEV